MAVVTLALGLGVAFARRGRGPTRDVLSCNMFPTLRPGDSLELDEKPSSIRRGDIVIYVPSPTLRRSDDDLRPSRVVALPGETIEFRADQWFINGRVLNESYLARGLPNNLAGAVLAPVTLPSRSYFVLGDNRRNSADSRAIGPVSDIRARAKKIHHGKAKGDAPKCTLG